MAALSADGNEGRLEEIRSVTKRDGVLIALQQAILSGRLKPGTRLVENELAFKLGVSRGPVRAALQELGFQGLVEMTPHKGATVQRFSAEDLTEIYTLRADLEGFATELAADRISAEELEDLNRMVGQFAQACKKHDLARVVELDLQFHGCLVSASRHRRLQAMMRTIHPQVKMFMVATKMAFATHSDLLEIVQEHQEVIDAMRRRDVPAARAAITKHIRQSGERLVAAIGAVR